MIEIKYSKKKNMLLLLGSLIFVVIGFWLLLTPQEEILVYLRGINVPTEIIGLVLIIFCGFCLFLYVRALFNNKPALIIDDKGITDKSSAVAAGQILWGDIEGISVGNISGQKFILLQVKNPREYIDRQPNALKRKIMEMNFKMCGTPLSITSNGLQISFEDLNKILVDKLSVAKTK